MNTYWFGQDASKKIRQAFIIWGVCLIIAGMMFGCGSSGGGSSNTGGGAEVENISEKVTISGYSAIYSGIVSAYTKNGTLLGQTVTDNINASFSLQVTPGSDYFINVKSGDGKRLVRCYISSVDDTGKSGITVDANSSALVYALEAKVSTIFAPNQSDTGNADLTNLSTQITSNAIFAVLVEAVKTDLSNPSGNAKQPSTEVQTIIKVFNSDFPVAFISSPENSAALLFGNNITFTGAGYDYQDGKLIDNSLVWTSNIDGQIGTGISFSTVALSAGKHTITLTATDSNGLTGTAVLDISILDTSQSKWVSFNNYFDYPLDDGIALRSDGTVWDIDVVTYKAQLLNIGNDWAQVTHNLGLKKDGTLWTMGYHEKSSGVLADGTRVRSFTFSPTQVGTENNWIQITSSANIALKSDGTLWGWGDNSLGQLGNTQPEYYFQIPSLTQIGSDIDWKYVVVIESTRVFAIKKNGTIWGWGDTGRDGPPTDRSSIKTPTQIGTDTGWQAVYLASTHGTIQGASYSLVAKKENGTLWDLYFNPYGNQGAGGYFYQAISGNNWSMAAGSYAIKSDGSMWDLTSKAPLLIDSHNDLAAIFNSAQKAIIKTDGTLWISGINIDMTS